MLTLIKNGEVYAPHYAGKKDILVVDKRIGFIQDEINLPAEFLDVRIIDAANKYIVPGFIDAHVHIIGGGGEGGYKTRTPELMLSHATTAGITTVAGLIGTDGTTRTMPSLIAKAYALNEEGITCYVYTGSYQVPVKTLTGKIEDDILLMEKVIGVGEIAIADHRSSQPTMEEIARLASDARRGGMLSDKAGIVVVHVGDSSSGLSLLEKVIEKTDIPISQFLPTHINRNQHLFNAGIAYAKKGGFVDLTTSTVTRFLREGEMKCSKGLRIMLEQGVPIEQITFTSDGQASLPEFNEKGEFVGLQIGKVSSLYKEVKDAVLEEGINLQTAIKVITSNPANVLKLKQKGYIGEGFDADLVLIKADTLEIDTVLAKGKIMVENQKPIIKGYFE